MTPTTTSVFVSPVRPQTGRSRTIQGLFGRAAGAHVPSLPAAQDGQAKRLPGLAGGSFNRAWSCRLFFVLLLCGFGAFAADQNRLPSSPEAVSPLTGQTAASKSVTRQLAAACYQSDNNLAPAMVVIRPGRYMMGSPANETGRDNNQGPQHQITIPRPFAISRCEITVGQFRQFIDESGYQTTAESSGSGCYTWNINEKERKLIVQRSWSSPGFQQSDDHPVVCVSWQDVQRYVDWLSQRTGTLYRLPTEAEWEYAARAGTQTPRYYVDNKQCDYANAAGQEAKPIADKNWVLADCNDGYVYTAPIASFAENQFGLFDMLGNAWEWTLDCYHESYSDAPVDGSAWLEGNCDRRVVRGGSWINDPHFLRSANRNRVNSDDAYNLLGFRVARAL